MSDSDLLQLVQDGKEFLTLENAGKLIGEKPATLQKAIFRDRLKAKKFGGLWVVERGELQRWKLHGNHSIGRPKGAKNKPKKRVDPDVSKSTIHQE